METKVAKAHNLRKRVIISQSSNIYENLALENLLFSQLTEDETILFLWQNTDSVVIGRFQDPEIECNLSAMQRDGILLARRQSGGGTVWHDMGNLCFTFMGSKTCFDRKDNLLFIVTVLRSQGFPVELNERHDILLQGNKISGSAFREKADRAFHHGTLLINSQLEKLKLYLTPAVEKKESRHIRSVRSPVSQLSEWNTSVSVKDIQNLLASNYSQDPAQIISAVQFLSDSAFTDYLAHIQSPAWIYNL
ncbi:hypothetical protein [Gracilinema caldarium]|uniref:lipoyl protein ligase domain-containing protein n=1 Tax=Gracilinema caldarium TaxID=215591 RepID=UPI0026EF5E8A|nr:hypothetical protein [Gracilinema caldarium]